MSFGTGLGINANFTHASSFSAVIGDPWSELNPYIRSVTTSSLSINTNNVPLGGNPNPLPYPSNKVHTTDFFVEFMIDERFQSFALLWQWFERTKDTIEVFGDSFKENRADIYVPIFESSQCVEIACFKYKDAFPKTLPSIVWTHDDNTNRATAFSVTFASAFPDLTYIDPDKIKKFRT